VRTPHSFFPSCSKSSFFLFLSFFLSFSLAISRIRPSSPRNTARSSRDASSRNYRTVFVAAVHEQSAQRRIVHQSLFVVTVTYRRRREGSLGYRATDRPSNENRRGGCTTLDLRTTTSCLEQTRARMSPPRSSVASSVEAPREIGSRRKRERERDRDTSSEKSAAGRARNSGCGNRAIYGTRESSTRSDPRDSYLPSLGKVESKVDIDSARRALTCTDKTRTPLYYYFNYSRAAIVLHFNERTNELRKGWPKYYYEYRSSSTTARSCITREERRLQRIIRSPWNVVE
jgi:hypothetical protein